MTDRTAEENSTQTAETMIRLEDLTKVFPAQEEAAVDDLSLEIYEGDRGPGRAFRVRQDHDHEDDQPHHRTDLRQNLPPGRGRDEGQPDKLRRRIGYVIQQIGLFPHMTIADNIATVPRMLGWEKRTRTV